MIFTNYQLKCQFEEKKVKAKNTISARLRNFFNDKRELREFLPFIVAKKVAFTLPFPKNEIFDYREYYLKNCEPIVSGIISEINEKFIFDAKMANKNTYAIWNTRCRLVYNPESIDFLSLLSSSKAGLLSPDLIKKLKTKMEVISDKDLEVLENIIDEETV